ncbi:MAG: cysteine--tRNA ligase [Candidatus Portnoybacteria bacterium CG_4_10_14_0_2_um_filter_44_20]|uniref:Cysteine--tRNA ligase n=3 Tax=Candidatus Portnoyibacteriota TaxID=1817913 RepID=A0A2H0KQQ4_9BACT|nr:MAG: cysteine--tRNA ligase [Candidatus Portnoybacteria bacterium CG11_big_fil_rev_8_21_14_0_20_44_10]PIZ71066.1 MAG: cysteine--tRNA ligase [Candidatus Portnoybacteria bacterium CG_4_10_14_0_2_um_filter_44_20]PJA62925.1 MAG: cysteine--tRNA ligase [Candidatus Portnoybacteria bacterium CG_4_9_14_3_um_filter_44_9]
MLKLYNTLTRKKEIFKPLKDKKVGLYTCGPTVYNYAHIGNLKKYIGDDVLKRVLIYNGYKVTHVMNITDVGHLVSDNDGGEDKIEKGAKEQGKTAWELARFFEDYFWKSLKEVGVLMPDVAPRATEHIKEQIKLIEKLEKRGFTYKTQQAVYFDVGKFPNYTKLTGQKLEDKKIGAREETVVDKDKKNPYDFALWFFATGRFKNHTMRWPSPWGEGFPGWHLECSAMSMKYLGDTFDIHTGGIDHLTVHHPNEIAQSEAATGKQFVRFWIHHDFLLVDGEKMSKSKKNFYTIEDIKTRKLNPLAFRYFCLNSHYRSKLNFTWQGLEAAQNALNNLYEDYRNIFSDTTKKKLVGKGETYRRQFIDAINDDLNTPQALAIMWEAIKDESLLANDKKQLLLDFDKVFGLGLSKIKRLEIPAEIKKLAAQREKLRREKKWQEADEIRKKIEGLGYKIEDASEKTNIKKV